MKKYLLIATAALGLSFAACTGGQKTESAQPANDAAQPEVTAPAPATVNPDSALVQYESLIDQAIDLQGKLLKGDASVTQDLQNVTDQMTAAYTALQNAAANLTPDQAQKLADLVKKWADAAPNKDAQK